MSDHQNTSASSQAPQNGMGTAALIMGILGFLCLPLVGPILAIVFGRIALKRAAMGQATNAGAAKAGYILGIIGVVFLIVGLVVTILIAIFGSSTPA
ncbi:unannotated protein [freshwater metagenome]|uniref:Unannotated protein n=1 Tax=freshwater metagenome TaxID=449393 RepID=A0A6J7GHE5_9ZZZZ